LQWGFGEYLKSFFHYKRERDSEFTWEYDLWAVPLIEVFYCIIFGFVKGSYSQFAVGIAAKK
jgi:hypothetical protein